MKLFHSPSSCSEGILLLLEVAGAEVDVVTVSLPDRQQRSADYLALNPKGKVPALQRDDGSLLTEFPAIALWIALAHPAARLPPAGQDGLIRAVEAMDYIVATLHMRGATLAVLPQKFTADPVAQGEMRRAGQEVLREGLDHLARQLAARDWLLGEFSVADAALHYLLRWQPRFDLPLPPELTAFTGRIAALRARISA